MPRGIAPTSSVGLARQTRHIGIAAAQHAQLVLAKRKNSGVGSDSPREKSLDIGQQGPSDTKSSGNQGGTSGLTAR